MKLDDIYKLYTLNPSICTDTRKIKEGDIYFALKGENFDGNKFATRAIGLGAAYCIVDNKEIANKNSKCILVNDVLTTLQQLALHHRKGIKAKIISLTGSNGKTTTKELILSVLSTTYKVNATKGNLNNHIGVPLTLLSFRKDLDFGIIEMGANHQKEIEFLTQIVEPDYGVITNFGKAHLEGFGGVEGVIKGKSELYDYLAKNNKTIFINSSDPIQLRQIGNYNNVYSFGEQETSDCNVSLKEANPYVTITYRNETIQSQLIGNYNFGNIAIATALGHFFKVPLKHIKSGIENYKPKNNRSEIIIKNSNQIILDAYNANPTSMLAALKNFELLPTKNKYLFLGDMFELGDATAKEHQAIVDYVENSFTKYIFFIGKHFYNCKTNLNSNSYKSFETFEPILKQLKVENASVIIKGSRGMALERILKYL